jgi:hypothetical protein
MATEDKSSSSPGNDMAKLLEAVHALKNGQEKLQSEIADIKKKVDGKKESKKGWDSDKAYVAALAPLCGLSSLGFGSPLFLPYGLRIAAARTLVLHRALERAAEISKALAKSGEDHEHEPDDKQHVFKWFFSRSPEEKKAMFELMQSYWKDK